MAQALNLPSRIEGPGGCLLKDPATSLAGHAQDTVWDLGFEIVLIPMTNDDHPTHQVEELGDLRLALNLLRFWPRTTRFES